ncbi:hypothetical protein L6R49_15975 [Myxococcota bacterium]|nr:hypothetical protein [Myxococcota bacterium]
MPSPNYEAPSAEDAPGGLFGAIAQLGLAAYMVLLLSVAGSAILCTGFAGYGVYKSTTFGSPLVGGSKLEAWRLNELRRWGVLGASDVPALYHDDSVVMDGSAGCLVLGDKLLRWDEGKTTAEAIIAGGSVSSFGDPAAPTVVLRQGITEIQCRFNEDEGGDRFLVQLKASAGAP